MSDFAKASLVGLILHQLGRTNPELLPSTAPDFVRNAHVTSQSKRDFLETIWREAGPEVLLSIGFGIKDIGYDPIWHDAVRAPNPEIVFEKWRRFEAYGHSQNRLRISETGENSATFQRYIVGGGTPTIPENFMICGLIIALLEINGCCGLQCDMPFADGAMWRIRDAGRFALPDNIAALKPDRWTIRWREFTPQTRKEIPDGAPPDIPLPRSCEPGLRDTIGNIARLLMRDVSRNWKVAALARDAGLSTRSLQRRLQETGLSFSQLVRLVRIHEACRILKIDTVPITTVGFCAGFSDSAHFSRDFRASMGMTPSDYRAALQLG